MRKKVLLMGYGKMGKIHGKYLSELGVNWEWSDPHIKLDVDDPRQNKDPIYNFNGYSHVILATPTSIHDKMLSMIQNHIDWDGKLLIEKPAITKLENLDYLDNSQVSVGMVERFNPAFITLKEQFDSDQVLEIDFIRCSAYPVSRVEVPSFIDVGIHDIDLLFDLFGNIKIQEYSFLRNNDTFSLQLLFNEGKIARFLWSNETFHKEREIRIRQECASLHCNLLDQTVRRHGYNSGYNTITDLYVEKGSAIKSELENFLSSNGNRIHAKQSHEFFLNLIEEFNIEGWKS